MRPADRFTYIQQGPIQSDSLVLTRCYLPVIGIQATALYQYFIAFYQPQLTLRFSHTLDYLDIRVADLEPAFRRLQAMDLLDAFELESGHYQIQLHAPLSEEAFLRKDYYRVLLEERIGSSKVQGMQQASLSGPAQTVRLSDVFQLTEKGESSHSANQDQFLVDAFKAQMEREGLRFHQEATDLLTLLAISEDQGWTWYETFVLAKETAVNGVISTKRMQEKLYQKTEKTPATSVTSTGGNDSPDKRIQTQFNQREQAIISEAKKRKPLEFLASLKKNRRATIIHQERETLTKMAKMGLLDEVINIIVLYTYNRVQSANLNESYALKVANDFRYQEIRSAEAAVSRINESQQKKRDGVASRKGGQSGSTPSKQSSSNVPKWSNPTYKNTTSDEEKAALEAEKQRLLSRLNQGGKK